MSCDLREIPLNVGAITAGQAVGFNLDSYPNSFNARAHIDYVFVDNRSDATVTFISDPMRPQVLPGERKRLSAPRGLRDAYFEANATVAAGDLHVVLAVCGEGF